jgi:hypothetical protein
MLAAKLVRLKNKRCLAGRATDSSCASCLPSEKKRLARGAYNTCLVAAVRATSARTQPRPCDFSLGRLRLCFFLMLLYNPLCADSAAALPLRVINSHGSNLVLHAGNSSNLDDARPSSRRDHSHRPPIPRQRPQNAAMPPAVQGGNAARLLRSRMWLPNRMYS